MKKMKLKAKETLYTVSGKTPLTKDKVYSCELLKKVGNSYLQTEDFEEAHFVVTTDNDSYVKTYKATRFLLSDNIWTLSNLEFDLSKKVSIGGYFKEKLLSKDIKVYHRRTFGDLFEYYSKYGVTEKMLITALSNLKFRTYYCDTPKGMVFFWRGRSNNYTLGKYLKTYFMSDKKIVTKYTATYLYNLLMSDNS
jgi:hypothetical protein